MSTPRRGVRRTQSPPRPAPDRPAGARSPAPPHQVTVAPCGPPGDSATGGTGGPRWLRVVEWVAWVLLWVSAVGAGYFLGKIEVAKVLFIAVMLAITVLPWLRWVRHGSRVRLPPERIAMLQGVLSIFVGLVLALSGTYFWALPLVVVELALSMLILVKTKRPAPQS